MRNGMSTNDAGRLGGLKSAGTNSLKKKQRIIYWNNNPKLCKLCDTPIAYEKRYNDFCNHSCAAVYNNKGIRRLGKSPRDCLYCNTKILNEKFCSTKCQKNYEWNIRKELLVKSGVDNSSENSQGKRYLIELHRGACQICGTTEWCNQAVPLVLDHINGNPYDNSLTNLRVICHNCNAQTPTFTGRNKGNGRFERAKRYIVEKQTINEMKADIRQQ